MKYSVTVMTEVTIEVEAENEADAVEMACTTAWQYDADRQYVVHIEKLED